jgi:hypothetical protein
MSTEDKSEVLKIAEDMGYNSEYSGYDKKTPEEFIKHGVTIQRKQSGTIKDLLSRMDGMTGEFQKMQSTFETTISKQQEKYKADLERQKEELQIKIEAAVDDRDTEGFKKLNKELKAVESEANSIQAKPDVTDMTKEQQYFADWKQNGFSFIDNDPVAQKEMNKALALFRIDNAGNATTVLNVKDELNAVAEHLKKVFPDKFNLKKEELPPGGGVGEGKHKGGSKTALTIKDLDSTELRTYKKWQGLLGKSFNSETCLKNIKLAREAGA